MGNTFKILQIYFFIIKKTILITTHKDDGLPETVGVVAR
jgi:hypothetical protein